MLSKETQSLISKMLEITYPKYPEQYEGRLNEGVIAAKREGFIVGATEYASCAQILEEALENIMQMKLEAGETDYKYAFNRCWHIANDTLHQYRNNLK